ncbi:MAG: NAD-glutamate dehydrogenase domain-containing protein [Myxococcota bacterium]|nr:NAD-glutamate dehydrogenase domain-containing protein [Myxococcota bacterium]
MDRKLARTELIDRLLAEMDGAKHKASENSGFAQMFAQAILKRVDNKYLFKHRLTTLGSQLADSATWVRDNIGNEEIIVRAFRPTEDDNGYALEGKIVETLMPDQPFVYDTLKLLMKRNDIRVHNSLNVIIPLEKNSDGQFSIQAKIQDSSINYSYTRWFVDMEEDITRQEILDDLQNSLRMSRAMVSDFHRMVKTIHDAANDFDYLAKLKKDESSDVEEVRSFLDWLTRDNFVFMGISKYSTNGDTVTVEADKGLGSMRGQSMPSGVTTDRVLNFFKERDGELWPIARVQKSALNSIVHRSGKVDEILIRTFDDTGQFQGGIGIHGLFTFKGLGEPGGKIPILRRKVARVISNHNPVQGSYEHKSLVSAFNSLPVEYLFEAKDDVIDNLLDLALRAESTGEFQADLAPSRDGSSVYVFVVVPKAHFSDELRSSLQTHLQDQLGASYCDHRIHIGKFGSVSLHFYCTGELKFEESNLSALREQLFDLGTPWSHRLRTSLDAALDERTSGAYFDRFGDIFPEGYTDIVHPDDCVVDIQHLDKLLADGRARFEIFSSRKNPKQALLRIYSQEEVSLTKILPLVDNFGIEVAEQYSFEVEPGRAQKVWINTLRVERGDDDLLAHRPALIDGIAAVFFGLMRSDRLNRLLLLAKITWQDVDLLRAYSIYSRQLAQPFQLEGVRKIFMTHKDFVRGLVDFFKLRFEPKAKLSLSQRAKKATKKAEELFTYLDSVKTFEEDRVLRTFLNYAQATMRTNFYVPKDGEHFLSFKIDSSLIEEMPSPRPLYEILVHHAELDGIHLRGGKVARGGLRWSDRPDDFRSEVLGLMATQMLKNTLIVPVGAKGGFVLTDPPEDYQQARSEADRLYKIFIRGLLEVTDNIVDGKVVGPVSVVKHDPDDPYLVVAADKGTAHLSDTANALSADANFWLSDAFASGGSIGYDHKEKGITAKGAWVSVRQHFLELDIDPETDPITAVGIGDMSGDVFGNGMLLSSSMKLLAAFNHRHIFIDPNPDPAKSFEERSRLFYKGRTQWTDYSPDIISDGGGVYDRNARKISLSEPAKKALGIADDALSGEEVIRAILKADVDLLWNGGIGTYVKASAETHQDVGDKDNDAVRVDALEVRAKVIGEGGNLGLTMKGRCEYAEMGGHVNLDAIDNSGGVDLSDHEVNLKTLLGMAVDSGELKKDDRDALLIRVGDAVCEDVLENSRINALGISLDVLRSEADLWSHYRGLMQLRDDLGFKRRVERLPNTTHCETRVGRGQGFFRPELGKLLAFSKMYSYRRLLEQPAGTPDQLLPFIRSYFPTDVVEQHGQHLQSHMLFNEIAATVQVNHIVGRAGIKFLPMMSTAMERDVSEVVACYFILEDILGIKDIRKEIEDLEGTLPTSALYPAHIAVDEHLQRAVFALLTLRLGQASLGWRDDIEPGRRAVSEFLQNPKSFLSKTAREPIVAQQDELVDFGLPKVLSQKIAALQAAAYIPAARWTADRNGIKWETFLNHFFYAGAMTQITPLRDKIARQNYEGDWDQLAIHSIDKALLNSLIDVVKNTSRTHEAPDESPTLSSTGPFGKIATQINAFSKERIPVSACFVLNERIREQVTLLSEQN